jgi:hypothetical protein
MAFILFFSPYRAAGGSELDQDRKKILIFVERRADGIDIPFIWPSVTGISVYPRFYYFLLVLDA